MSVTQQQTYYYSKSQIIGYAGELWATRQLEKLGYQVRLPSDFRAKGVDAIINGVLPCEVKIAHYSLKKRQGRRAFLRWQWDVASVDSQDRVLILIAQDRDGEKYPFIMPGAIMAHRSIFEINSHPTTYRGRVLRGTLNAWGVVDYLLEKRYRNGGQLNLPLWRCK